MGRDQIIHEIHTWYVKLDVGAFHQAIIGLLMFATNTA